MFLSVRYGPKYLVKNYGGKEKIKVLMEAEKVSRKANTWKIQKGVGEFLWVCFIIDQSDVANCGGVHKFGYHISLAVTFIWNALSLLYLCLVETQTLALTIQGV